MNIKDLQKISPVGFGTSGVRGLVTDMNDYVCYMYTTAFLKHIKINLNDKVVIAGDLRPSTERIMKAVAKAIDNIGAITVNGGRVPSPAIANYGIINSLPTIMVTGSHIPSDRNGIKFTTKDGEITKNDELKMLSQDITVPVGLFDDNGYFTEDIVLPSILEDVKDSYIERYTSVFPSDFLKGYAIAFYSHSSVGRDTLIEIYKKLGADIKEICRSDEFIPVDTEAIREEDEKLADENKHRYDAILSADGDCDRPLIADENGRWIRGDILGIFTAKYLNAIGVVAPVSCNTALEKSNWFVNIYRTPIGSPYVIAGMNFLTSKEISTVVGYEANGGFLINTPVNLFEKMLPALPTRDPVIVHLAILGTAKKLRITLSELLLFLPKRFTYSDRIKDISREYTIPMLAELASGKDLNIIINKDKIEDVNLTDGVRFTYKNNDIIHLRGSGNAPELRCYAESYSEKRAKELVITTLKKIKNPKT